MKLFLVIALVLGLPGLCKADENLSDKTQATANDIGRAGKEGLHRTQEALCGKLTGDNKVQCLAKAAKNRMEEGKDAVVDKGSELKKSIENDKK